MKILSINVLLLLLLNFNVHAKKYFVKNIVELEAADSSVQPGDIVILKNGEWKNCKITLTCQGNEYQPVIFMAETNGKVIITGNSFLHIGGNFIVVEGLLFQNGYSLDEDVWCFSIGNTVANNCRITNCAINGFNNPKRMQDNNWVVFFGKNNRIDHCSFINKTNLGVLMAVKMDDERSRNSFHQIDSNYFGFRLPLGSNGGEIIRIGLAQHCTFNSNSIVKDNVFERCDGETEIISIKSSANIIRHNLFKECQGALVLRHGSNNTVEGNCFLGNNKEGSGGVRIINEGNWVVNNLFDQCRGVGFRSPLSVMNGVFNSPPTRYVPVRNTIIANNSFIQCSPVSFGEGADSERAVSPVNVFCFNNYFKNYRDTSIYFVQSKTDSIYYNSNICEILSKKTLMSGFENLRPLTIRTHNEINSKNYSSPEQILPTLFLSQASSRLENGFLNLSGSYSRQYFDTLLSHSKKMGIQWKMNLTSNQKKEILTKKILHCKTADELYDVVSENHSNVIIQLTGKAYYFNKPIVLQNNIEFKGSNKKINFNSTITLSSLFVLSSNVKLSFKDVEIDFSKLEAKHIISTDAADEPIHYSVSITNCQFEHSTTKESFFHSFKSSFADEITVTNSIFHQIESNIFSVESETDDKGLYNAENITLNDCIFSMCKGQILSVYRGGTDESTLGPKIYFNRNLIKNCNSDNSLIQFYGVQFSQLFNNDFIGSNSNSNVIKYSDRTRAIHLQQKNSLVKSGLIIENKFVTNLN